MLFFFPNRWSKRPSLNMPKLNLTLVWDNVGTSPKSNAHLSFHHENLLVNVLWIAKRSFDQNEKHQNQKILQNAYQSCRTSSQKMRHAHKPIRRNTLSVQNTIRTSRTKTIWVCYYFAGSHTTKGFYLAEQVLLHMSHSTVQI